MRFSKLFHSRKAFQSMGQRFSLFCSCCSGGGGFQCFFSEMKINSLLIVMGCRRFGENCKTWRGGCEREGDGGGPRVGDGHSKWQRLSTAETFGEINDGQCPEETGTVYCEPPSEGYQDSAISRFVVFWGWLFSSNKIAGKEVNYFRIKKHVRQHPNQHTQFSAKIMKNWANICN